MSILPLTTQKMLDLYNLTCNVFVVSAMQSYVRISALDDLVSPTGPQYGTVEINGTNISLESGGLASVNLTNQEESGAVDICASGLAGAVSVSSVGEESNAMLMLNTSGALLSFGLGELLAQVALNGEALSLSMGPGGEGSSITMTPESITFQVGETIMTMTAAGIVTEAQSVEINCDDTNISISPEGINEEVGEVTREMNVEGHNFTAGEVEYNVGVEGIVGEGPTMELEFEAASEISATANSITGEAMLSQEAPITMFE